MANGRFLVALGVLGLLVAGVAVWFGIESNRLSGDADRLNVEASAFTAARRTSEALRPVIEKVLAFDYRNPDNPAVEENLAGKARCEYDRLFAEVKHKAAEQKLVLTSRVREIGLTRLAGDQAELLVFVDQTTVRGDRTSSTGAQLALGAQRQAGAWKITRFDFLGQSTPAC